jgi:hypothetical protein
MSECTERAKRSEGHEAMPSRLRMSECTERAKRSEGRQGMPKGAIA